MPRIGLARQGQGPRNKAASHKRGRACMESIAAARPTFMSGPWVFYFCSLGRGERGRSETRKAKQAKASQASPANDTCQSGNWSIRALDSWLGYSRCPALGLDTRGPWVLGLDTKVPGPVAVVKVLFNLEACIRYGGMYVPSYLPGPGPWPGLCHL